MSNEIVQGDNGTVIELTIQDGTKIIDLTDATVQIILTLRSSGKIKQAIITDAINGKCEVTLISDDILYDGVYTFQAVVYFSDGRQFTSNIQKLTINKKIGFIPTTNGGNVSIVSGNNGHILVNNSDIKVYDDSVLQQTIQQLNIAIEDLNIYKTLLSRLGISSNDKLTIDGIEQIGSQVLDTTPPTVTISPIGGTYNSVQTISLSGTDNSGENITIYYTLDGSIPTTSSMVYTNPFNISTDTAIKFFGKDIYGNAGSIQTVLYTIDTPVIDTNSPNDVTNFSTSNITANSIQLHWILSNSNDVKNYEVSYSTDGGVSYIPTSSFINSSSSSYIVDGLSPDTSYKFLIIAIDTSNNKSNGITTNATTLSVVTTNAIDGGNSFILSQDSLVDGGGFTTSFDGTSIDGGVFP